MKFSRINRHKKVHTLTVHVWVCCVWYTWSSRQICRMGIANEYIYTKCVSSHIWFNFIRLYVELNRPTEFEWNTTWSIMHYAQMWCIRLLHHTRTHRTYIYLFRQTVKLHNHLENTSERRCWMGMCKPTPPPLSLRCKSKVTLALGLYGPPHDFYIVLWDEFALWIK